MAESRSAGGGRSQLVMPRAVAARSSAGLPRPDAGQSGFQRFAGTFALTRPIARRRASALFDLCAGFVYSQILLACVRLRAVRATGRGAAQRGRPSSRCPAGRCDRLLLDAAVSLKLAQRRSGGRYGLGPLGAALMGNPGIVAMIEHHAMLYGDLAIPLHCCAAKPRQGSSPPSGPMRGPRPPHSRRDAVAPYTALMAASQPMIAQQVLSAYSFRDHRCLLDIGGGDGSFLARSRHRRRICDACCSICRLSPTRPAKRFARRGLSSRAVAIGGSFLTDRLPEGADIVSLVRVIHDHDDADVMTLLRAIRRALPDNGTLLIAEPIRESAAPSRSATPISHFTFWRWAAAGRDLRAAAAKCSRDAGFADIALRRPAMPLLTSVITARGGQQFC